MKVKDAHMQAFPFIEPTNDEAVKAYHSGISLRDYFAAKAMQGFAARDVFDAGLARPDQRAKLAYIEADAMLEARK